MSSESFHHVVVGAGIVGSCTARQLQKRGRRVLLVEKFRLPHTRGSSHGQTRLIRSCYEEEQFASLMPRALKLWDELEKETGAQLILKTGVWCLSRSKSYLDKLLANMEKFSGGRFRTTSVSKFCEQYPVAKYPGEHQVMFDETGGVIVANKALSAVQELFRSKGGLIWDGNAVQSVDLSDDLITVSTADGRRAVAPSLVVCAGAWTPEVFQRSNPELSSRLRSFLQATAVRVYYWRCKDAQSFPTFIDTNLEEGEDISFYGLSPPEYPGMMKICFHGGVPCNPDERDKAVFEERFEKRIKQYIAEHWPGLEHEPCIVEKCMYTTTPDENFVVDYLYEHKNVILGCGFSGTGFKTAPVVAEMICKMALGEPPTHDFPEFKLARFAECS